MGTNLRWGALAVAAATLAAMSVTTVPAAAAPPRLPDQANQTAEPHPFASAGASLPARHVQTSSGIPWAWQNPHPSGNPLYAISCPTTMYCWAGGYDSMANTTDGGASWQTQPSSEVNGISCADTTHCVAVGNGGVVLTTANGTSWSMQVLNNGNFLAGVSCPSSTVCYAIGANGFVFKSMDGGLTWTNQQQVSQSSFYAMTCSSTTYCIAVGANGLAAVTINGSSWSATNTGTSNGLYGISCATAVLCLAAGQDGAVTITTSGGSGWFSGDDGTLVTILGVSCTSSTACFLAGADGSVYARNPTANVSGSVSAHGWADENGVLYAISCPGAATCFTDGSYGTISVTTNGGTGWTRQSGSTNQLFGVNCPSTSSCFLVGRMGTIAHSADGGATWTGQASGTTLDLYSISCASTTVCVAVGGAGAIVNTADGATWTVRSSGVGNLLNDVSCPSVSVCYVVTANSAYLKSTDGGNTWTSGAVGAALGLVGISCPSISICFAADDDNPMTSLIYETGDGGATWTVSFNLANDPQATVFPASFSRINCPTTSICYAVGGSGLIAATSDGGANWRTDGPNSNANLSGVSCSSAGVCVASGLDSTALRTIDYGATWQPQMSVGTPEAVSCPSDSVCVMVNLDGTTSRTATAGAAFALQRPTGSTAGTFALSCFGFSNCAAASLGNILVSHDAGGTWTPHALGTTDLALAVSCPSASVCYAAGWPGVLYKTTDGGSTWLAQSSGHYGSDNTFTSISCADTLHCVAVGTEGLAVSTGDGTTWTTESTGTTTGIWFGVACPSPAPIAGQCVAVGAGGIVATRAAGSWTPRTSGTANTLGAVTCKGSNACLAVGRAGTVLASADGGMSWAPRTSGITTNLHGVDCSEVNRCIAVGDRGTAIVTADGSTWANLSTPTPNQLRGVSYKDTVHVLLAGLGSTIIGEASCSYASLSSNVPSPQPQGAKVTFTASASGPNCSSPLFEWWTWSSITQLWNMQRAYSANSQFTLDTSGMQPGTLSVDVWVEESGSLLGTANYETFGLESWVVQGCDSASMTPNPGPTTGTYMFTVTVGGSGCTNPEYQFWVYSIAGGWQMKQAYSSSPTWTIDTSTLAAGTYSIDAWVRQKGSPLQYETWALSTIPKGACGTDATTTIAPTQSSPQSVGGTVHVGSVSTCGATPTYRYYTFPNTTNLFQIPAGCDLNLTGACDWSTSGYTPGTQSLVVHVFKNPPASGQAPDTWGLLSYTLDGCQSVSLAAAPSSHVSLGTSVTLTATPSPSCNAPQYQFWYFGPGGWHMVQDFSSNANFNWNTTSLPPGTYAWVVYIKQSGDGNSYDSFALISVTVS